MSRTFLLCFLAVFALTLSSCSSSLSDAVKRSLSVAALNRESSFILISNSTTSEQPQCAQGNTVVVQKSFPAGREVFCRDKATLSPTLSLGKVCPGGVDIVKLSVSETMDSCQQPTLCGIVPSSIKVVGTRADGGTIEELEYRNLPWGCDAKTEISFEAGFAENATSALTFFVQPPECPFCSRQNQATCLPCADLTETETIKSGQVVVKNCTGRACASCPVLRRTGETVPHGESRVYFKSDSGGCTTKCSQNSLVRVCNDGLWQGDPAYSYPQCFDSACGCLLPGDPVRYAHNALKTIYKSNSPACGVDCKAVSLDISCNDGTWQTGTPVRDLTAADFTLYPALACSKRVCHCERPGRDVVADGQSKIVFSKSPVACTEKCSDFQGEISCKEGTLSATNPNFLTYSKDSCMQEDCGCRVPLANGFTLLADGGSTKLYRYAQNTPEVPDACSNPAYQTTVSCQDKVLSAYDGNLFKYTACTYKPLSCYFTNGAGSRVELAHSSTMTVSKIGAPDCGVACENLALTCDNTVMKKSVGGVLTPVAAEELALYKSATRCVAKNCNCTVNGNVISYNTTRSGFFTQAKFTNCDLQACSKDEVSITCTKTGPVTSKGDDPLKYKFRGCEVVPCGCALKWGGTLEDGKTVRVFSVAKPECTTPAACEDPLNSKVLTCSNGMLTPYDEEKFKSLSCAPPVCTCTHKTASVPFGESLKVYTDVIPPSGGTCESISATVKCEQGGAWTGANLSLYPQVACDDPADDGIGGGTGGGGGNDEGPGFGIKKRFGLGDGGGGGGGPCLSLASCRTIMLDTSMPLFTKRPCILPWGGGEAEFYSSVAAFDKQCVKPPDKCSNHRTVRTCHFPEEWTGDNSFRFPSCEESPLCP